MEKKSDTSMLVQSVKRNILFWGRQAENVFLIFFIAIVFYGVMIEGMYDIESGETFEEVMASVRTYAMIFSGVVPFMVFSIYGLPKMGMVLSFGARRSETFFGVHFMVWLLNIQMIFIVLLCSIFMGGNFEWIGIYLAAVLLCTALGEFSGCMVLKFGNKGIWISVILMLVGSIASGLLFAFSRDTDFWGENVVKNMSLVGIAVGLILYTAGTLIWKKLLSSYEVKM